jgi:hypothetical protein
VFPIGVRIEVFGVRRLPPVCDAHHPRGVPSAQHVGIALPVERNTFHVRDNFDHGTHFATFMTVPPWSVQYTLVESTAMPEGPLCPDASIVGLPPQPPIAHFATVPPMVMPFVQYMLVESTAMPQGSLEFPEIGRSRQREVLSVGV